MLLGLQFLFLGKNFSLITAYIACNENVLASAFQCYMNEAKLWLKPCEMLRGFGHVKVFISDLLSLAAMNEVLLKI